MMTVPQLVTDRDVASPRPARKAADMFGELITHMSDFR
jgi:hypothetical protein